MDSISFDASIWAALAALGTFVCAWLAYRSNLISKQALALAKSQEQRRKPSFTIYLNDGYVRFLDGKSPQRIYAFLLSVSSPSEADNAIAHLDLHITYSTEKGLQMTLKVPADDTLSAAFNEGANMLSIPSRIDAHQTIAGWCYFKIEENLLAGTMIEAYKVVVTDSHSYQASVEPLIVRELVDEINIQKKRN